MTLLVRNCFSILHCIGGTENYLFYMLSGWLDRVSQTWTKKRTLPSTLAQIMPPGKPY